MLRTEPVEVRACLTAQVEQVLEAGVADEGRARTTPLEQRVRRNSRAVCETLDLSASRDIAASVREPGVVACPA